MRHASWKLGLALFALLSAPSRALPDTADDSNTAYVDGEREAVIAFVPIVTPGSPDGDAAEAHKLAVSAVETMKRCMGESRTDYRVVSAERIVVRLLNGDETFELDHGVALAGALLLRPGSNPRILFAGGGPEALVLLLRQESKEYLGQNCDAG